MRPLWADFVIVALVFWIVLLPLEFGGEGALYVAAAASAIALAALAAARLRRRTPR